MNIDERMALGEAIDLPKQKEIMVDVLEKSIAFFEEHGLTYFLGFGTLLGAIRHKGFIPWDNDIDLVMPIEDCEKLIELVNDTPIAENIRVSSIQNNKDHIWSMIKIICTDTYLVEPSVLPKYMKRQENFGGVYIDVFPIYGLPDDEKKRKAFWKKIRNLCQKMRHSSKTVNFDSAHGGALKTLAYKICFIPNRILGLDYYLKKIAKLVKTYPFGETKYCASVLGQLGGMKDVVETEIYKSSAVADFEGLKCNIPERYDDVLKTLYGNYMELPPESQRRTHPREVFFKK